MRTWNTVAIVEDDRSALAALSSLVGAFGYWVRGFHDASDFLACGAAQEVSCLIADVRLPGIGGFELYRRLAGAGLAPPTILVTAYPDETTRALALSHGIIAYLGKPVAPEELQACLRRAMA